MKKQKRVFLDYASTTPLDSRVFSAMKPFATGFFSNPSALYEEAVAVKKHIENFRSQIAAVLHAHPDEIVFTGSGTESDNLAILGVYKATKKIYKKPHFITSIIEHPGVLEAFRYLEEEGASVTYLPVNTEGFINPDDLKKAIRRETVLVSIMYANNEIGTIQPIRDLVKVVRGYRKNKKTETHLPYFHTDASQAALYLDLNVLSLGIDLLTLDGSKIYGPKGIGALFVKRGVKISPIIYGGGQEKKLRSGTESALLISGFSKAITIASSLRESESKRLTKIRDQIIKKIKSTYKKVILNGAEVNRLPNNINICFPGVDAEFLVLKLDANGILVSGSSSCRTLSENSKSYVVEALGRENCSESSIRITLGRDTKKEDVNLFLKVLKKVM